MISSARKFVTRKCHAKFIRASKCVEKPMVTVIASNLSILFSRRANTRPPNPAVKASTLKLARRKCPFRWSANTKWKFSVGNEMLQSNVNTHVLKRWVAANMIARLNVESRTSTIIARPGLNTNFQIANITLLKWKNALKRLNGSARKSFATSIAQHAAGQPRRGFVVKPRTMSNVSSSVRN